MPNYLRYTDIIETIAPDKGETHNKIIEVMSKGGSLAREKYGRSRADICSSSAKTRRRSAD